jgi:hypothetical protein
MKRFLLVSCALATMVLCSGCMLFVEVPTAPATTVRAENDLTNLSVDVNGQVTHVYNIDLTSVTIGDILYTHVYGGTLSSEVATSRRGTVDVTIGSADVTYATALGQAVTTFYNIAPMQTTITEGTLNTVVFDTQTAGVIFAALAKRLKQ